MKVTANKSILHNNTTGCTFIASQMDENVQTGTRTNDSHIEWMGNLNIPVNQHEAQLIEALEGFVNSVYAGCTKQELDKLRIKAETALLKAKGL